MEPYSLHLTGVLLTFIIKVTAGFVLCLVLAYLLSNPRHRFLTWLGFFVGAGLAWIDMLAGEAVSIVSAARGGALLEATVADAGKHLTVPANWGFWIARVTLALAAMYVAGATTLLVLEVHKHLRLRALVNQGQQPSPQLRRVFQRICCEFNIRSCRLLILPRIKSPATVYWWRPQVILPDFCEGLAETQELENVLRHELIHTLRCDYLWATLADLVCALLFFHPSIRNARRRMILQRELACDLAVIEVQPEHRADYADSLTRFVRLLIVQQQLSPGVEFLTPSSFLGTRIRCILTEPEKVPGWKRIIADVVFVGFVVIFGSISPALSVSLAVSPEPPRSIQPRPALHDKGPMQHPGRDQQGGSRSMLRARNSRSTQSQTPVNPAGNGTDHRDAKSEHSGDSYTTMAAPGAGTVFTPRDGRYIPKSSKR